MFKEQLKNLPKNPGVYIMRNSIDEVIYVGKAKNLKNRVTQYFQSSKNHAPKVLAMVANISRFEYIITGTEFEALVLECNLIKQYRPKYNILLKDDKSHPYIKVTLNEEYPRIILARKIERDGARYFGPYLSAFVVNETIDIIKKVFYVRSCNRVLPRDIGKSRPCLNFHIKQCSAPCNNKISQIEYKNVFIDIISFLDGKHNEIIDKLTIQMTEASKSLEFERAAKIRDKINAIKKITEKQRVVSTAQGNQDIIAFADDNKTICIQVFFVRNGKVVGREHFIIKNEQQDSKSQIMTSFVKQYYGMATYVPSTIILQHDIEDMELVEKWLSEKCEAKIQITVPQKGEKLNIVKMVEKNAIETLKLNAMKHDISKRKMDDLMFELKETLGLKNAPMRIEAYDISNISGTDSVGVCVVFENGVPKKGDYRKFNIRSTTTPDDYESMKEVVYRRISNGVNGEKGFTPLPDLILLDGGKGHVSTVLEVLKFFNQDIPLFGVVKDDKHKTRGLTTAAQEIGVKRTSSVFKFLTRIQDEVHRFAITAHRKKHKKTTIASELENINGVGEKRRSILLKHFKTIKAIKNATIEELSSVNGIDSKTASAIFEYFSRDV